MKFFTFILVCIVFLSMAEHGGKYPVNVFNSPVQRDFKLSGTFGELRTNHFHAGLDIKSENGLPGDPVYASYEGFISRIKVEEYGYGNVLYLEHPNGFTTVYAHLDRFAPEIDQYVKNEQYKAENFEVDLYPDKERFPVHQSDKIAYMGNTGSSYGPHLHFEIRHTKGQVPVNPLLFGFNVADQRPPVIQQLIVYEYNDAGDLLSSKVLQPTFDSSGRYSFAQPIALAGSKASFALRAYDMQDGASNQNGIYSIQCKVDEDPSFAFTLDEIPFEQTRYINAHIDYAQKINEDKFFHRCHPLEGNKLPIYYSGVDDGMIYMNTEFTRKVNLTVADFNSNVSTLFIELVRDLSLVPQKVPDPPFQVMASPDQVSIVSGPGIQVVWPKGSFYEKTPLNIDVIPEEGLGTYSPHYALSPVDAPVHYYFDINIEGLAVPAALRDKAFIARCEPNGSIINCGATWIGNNLSTGARTISTYAIMIDRMAFKISDNFVIKDRGRDLIFDAWVDGKWILMSLDGKSGILTHIFDGHIPSGDHQLILKVTDDRGNEAVLEKTFTL
jgi:Peptidase family M23